MSDMTDAAGRIDCESHHWVSTNVPGLLTRWVIQCSLCGVYNVEEMNAAALSAAGSGPAQEANREAWAEGHESGFWNGRLSQLNVPYDAPDPLIGKQHADATNPYREDT